MPGGPQLAWLEAAKGWKLQRSQGPVPRREETEVLQLLAA